MGKVLENIICSKKEGAQVSCDESCTGKKDTSASRQHCVTNDLYQTWPFQIELTSKHKITIVITVTKLQYNANLIRNGVQLIYKYKYTIPARTRKRFGGFLKKEGTLFTPVMMIFPLLP